MRNQLLAVAVATAIVATACGSTPDAEIAVNAPETTITEPDTSVASGSSAEELRADFIAAATAGDTARVDELLAAADPGGDLLDMLASMMEQGVNMSAGDDDCAQPGGCYVFTDWFQAFQLRMETDANGNWSITGVSLESTD